MSRSSHHTAAPGTAGAGGERTIIEAIFEFAAKNPPTFLIGGGVLMYVLGSLQQLVGANGGALLGPAPWLIGGGFVLQVLWLVLR